MPRNIPLRAAYPLLVGTSVGALLTGVLLPFVVDGNDRLATAATRPNDSAETGFATPAEPDPAPDAESLVSNPTQASAAVPGGASTASTSDVEAPGARTPATGRRIRVGALLVDVGGAARIGVNVPSVDPGQQREAYEAFFADAEHRSGWEIERVYATFDVLNSDDQRAACLKLVEDARVDIAMIAGGFNTSQFSCFTHEHAVPVIAAGDSGSPEELYSGRAALFTMMQRSSRQMFNWAAELHSAGDLSRKTVGLVSDRGSDPRGAVVNGQLKASLRQFGYEVAHVTTFSEDMNSAATQVPVEVQQMRQKGVDAVFLATRWPYATQFVQAAASQGWRPAWFASDFAGMSSDEANQNMGQSYEGSDDASGRCSCFWSSVRVRCSGRA